MSMRNPYETYQTNAVTTASPGELTLMLYNGCLKFVKQAKQAIESNEIEKKNRSIQRAQDIVQELMVTLNTDIPVSKSMMQMYDYINRRLIEANIKNDSAMLDEVEGYVLEFRDAWKEVIRQSRLTQYREGGQA